MMKNYCVADVVFRLKTKSTFTEQYCEKYRVDDDILPHIYIETTDDDIAYEKEKDPHGMSDGYLESLAVYRKLCEELLDYDTFLFHCSAVAVDGKAYLFTAPSGTGKSTHVRLWQKVFGERAVVINDDKPLLQVRENHIYACGTPWNGKHGIDTNIKVPVQGICILGRGKENRIWKISSLEGYPSLYKQAYRPYEQEKVRKTLKLLKQLAERIPLYKMECTISEEAAQMAWDAMSRD